MVQRKNDDGAPDAIGAQIIADRDGKPTFAVVPFEVFLALAAYAREGVQASKSHTGGASGSKREGEYLFENAKDFRVLCVGETGSFDQRIRAFVSHSTDDELATVLKHVGDWLSSDRSFAAPEAGELDEDLAAYDAARTRDEERFPAEVADRLIAGESPLKVFREYRGLTQGQLAKTAKTTAPYLSQIENGRRTGSVGLLRRLADALRIEIDDLA
jgi:DNA-binding XRE family transcriptional regulator